MQGRIGITIVLPASCARDTVPDSGCSGFTLPIASSGVNMQFHSRVPVAVVVEPV